MANIEPSEKDSTSVFLPQGEDVFRFLKNFSSDNMVSASEFELSTEDKSSLSKSLSVWAISKASPMNTIKYLGEFSASYQYYFLLSVDDIRSIISSETEIQTRPLDVIWEPHESGAPGHAGITGLNRPPNVSKIVYRSIRISLADLANLRGTARVHIES